MPYLDVFGFIPKMAWMTSSWTSAQVAIGALQPKASSFYSWDGKYHRRPNRAAIISCSEWESFSFIWTSWNENLANIKSKHRLETLKEFIHNKNFHYILIVDEFFLCAIGKCFAWQEPPHRKEKHCPIFECIKVTSFRPPCIIITKSPLPHMTLNVVCLTTLCYCIKKKKTFYTLLY
jgi:hypothetical protein